MAGRTVVDYLRMLQSLLPRGRAWPRSNSSRLGQFLTAIADEFVRLEAAALDLIAERDTRYTTDLLPEHEYDLGLPDACSPVAGTLAQRRTQAHTKLVSLGGQHKQYYIDLAARLGYTVSAIYEYPDSGLTNIFHWKIVVNFDDDVYLIWFTSGGSVSGDPISQITSIDVLTCYLERYKPAHTKLFIDLDGPEFGQGFDISFDSLPSEDVFSGAFGLGFSIAFDVFYGGEFDFDEFGDGFRKPG